MKKIIKKIYFLLRSLVFNVLLCLISLRQKEVDRDKVKTILVIRLDRVGDLVLSTPCLRALRQEFPYAHISLLVSSAAKDLLKGSQWVDEILEYSSKLNLTGQGFDLVVDLMSDPEIKTAWIAYRTNARYRVGFDIYGRGVFFNIPVKLKGKNRRITEYMLDLCRAIDISSLDSSPELVPNEEAKTKITQLLEEHQIKENDLVVCFHPGGFYPTQRWLPERFAQVADEIKSKYHATIVMLASENEMDLITDIQKQMKHEMIAYVGQSLDLCVALVNRAQLFIGNNSGIVHMASALGIPTISTMGPTNAKRWWPVGERNIVIRKDIECIGCESGKCLTGTHDCMNLITVDDMLEAVKKQLSI